MGGCSLLYAVEEIAQILKKGIENKRKRGTSYIPPVKKKMNN